MRNIRTFLFLGIWLTVLPYLGFPHLWKNVLYTFSGLLLIFFSYMRYRVLKRREQMEYLDTFLENKEFEENNQNN